MAGWGAAIAGAADLINTSMTNDERSKEAAANREFQAFMSNTSYQRGVADMKKAGLSPMLMYSKGGGASTPAGDSAQPAVANIGTAVQAAAIRAQIEKMEAETDLTEAQEEQVRALTPGAPGLQSAQTTSHLSSAGLASATTSQVLQEMQSFEKRMEQLGLQVQMNEQQAFQAMMESERLRAIYKDRPGQTGRMEKIGDAMMRKMIDEARKIANEAEQRGLEIPELVQRAMYWRSPAGKARPYTEHGGEVVRDLNPLHRMFQRRTQ